MTSQGTEVAVFGTLRDVLRALEQEESECVDHPSWHDVQATRGNVIVSRIERLPAADAVDSDAGHEPPLRWRDRIASKVPMVGPSMRAAAVTAPMACLLYAALLFLVPESTSEWAGAALDEVGSGNVNLQALAAAPAGVEQPTLASAERSQPESVPDNSAEPLSGFLAFAMIGERVLAAAVSPAQAAPPVYTVAVKENIEARPGEAVDLPFDIAGAETLPPDARLIVRGVPENASLTAAEPQEDGSWAIPVEKAKEVKLTAYALPKQPDHQLVAELRSGQGELLARATTWLTSPNAPASVAAAPKSKPQARPAATSEWATFAVAAPASQADPKGEAVPDDRAEAKEKPEWMQFSRSALGGPR